MRRRARASLVWTLLLLGPGARAQPEPLSFREAGPLLVALDQDDDDEDGVSDRAEQAPPRFDRGTVHLRGRGWATLETPEGLRTFRGDRPLAPSARVALPVELGVQGLATGEHTLILRARGEEARLPVRVIAMRFESPAGRVDPRRSALRPSLHIPNDAALPRDPLAEHCDDPAAFRVVVEDPTQEEPGIHALVRALDGEGRRGRLPIRLHRRDDGSYASPWLRLVTDPLDATAPGVEGRLLQVGLRDVVELDYLGATQSVRVGRPPDEDGPLAARRARLDIHVLRHAGRPVIGPDAAGARAWAAEQVAIASRVWTQCLIDFEAVGLTIHEAPVPALLGFGEPEGFLAAGGSVRFVAGETPIGPVAIPPGADPLDAALRVARAVRGAGFEAQVTLNPRAHYAARPSADLLVRRDGEPVALRADEAAPITDDARLRVRIATVDLADGLQEFDNRNAAGGTLEERALVLPTHDDDPSTIDLYVVNRFTGQTRQGEAFIEADEGALINTVILDRRGLEQERTAFTQAHEIGHVLLDQPFHPDDGGDPVPWRLMSAGAADPTIRGPRRLTSAECARARDRSGPTSRPVLLQRHPSPRGR